MTNKLAELTIKGRYVNEVQKGHLSFIPRLPIFVQKRELCISAQFFILGYNKTCSGPYPGFPEGGLHGCPRVCMHKHVRLGGRGACSPKEILNALRLLLRPFWDRSRVYSRTASDRNKDNLVCITHYIINVARYIFLRYVHTHFSQQPFNILHVTFLRECSRTSEWACSSYIFVSGTEVTLHPKTRDHF